ncbi:hypothetical protein BVRB_6g133520 [Beta vulgaris subsp. vulgaris]|nr:hypothetical protein BVRB_6g133520 [Beta vulgaris subsp. vulgaris]
MVSLRYLKSALLLGLLFIFMASDPATTSTISVTQHSDCYPKGSYCVYSDDCCEGVCDLNMGQGGGFYGMCCVVQPPPIYFDCGW